MRAPRLFASYAAVFALLAAPWLVHAAQAIPINTIYARGDTRLLTWILWWVSSALLHDPRTILDAPINYPAREQLTGSEHFAGLQLIFLPVYALTDNPVLALNAVLFLAYPLAALAMNRLLVALGTSAGVAWVVGLVYALGALQVPTHVHLLHTLAFFPPAVALALHRLREHPDARRTAILAALLLVAFFSAFYTTAILLPLIAACVIAELLRPLAGRWRFASIVAASVLGALAVLLLASRAYLARGAALAPSHEVHDLLRQMHFLSTAYLLGAPVQIFGAVALALGAAGCCALRDRRLRALALLGLALCALSVFLIAGGPLALTTLIPSERLATLAQAPLNFFRVVIRWSVLGGVGLALLAAAALEWARARLAPRAGLALLALVALAVTGERGRMLYRQALDTPVALTTEAPVYRTLASVLQRDGGGPVLELPVSSSGYSLQPEAMLGEIQHGQPLIVGHTGYLPPHRRLVDATIARLPAESALQDLVDLTMLRWVVIRPESYWGGGTTRADLVRDLEAIAGVQQVAEVSGWTVLEVGREPVDRTRFAAIANGPPPRRVRRGAEVIATTLQLVDARGVSLPLAGR